MKTASGSRPAAPSRAARLAWAAVLALMGPVALLFILAPLFHSTHEFADTRTRLGIPNFWNVVSNLSFLAVAIWGLRAFRNKGGFTEAWERLAYSIVLSGAGLVAFGSSYYHWAPNDQTLFWDRLPMTLLFMGIFAATIGERLAMAAGRWLVLPLVAAGIASAVWWRSTGDVRPYAVVQYVPMIAIPAMLLFFPPRYTKSARIWGMVALYGLAKALELGDGAIGRVLSTGGHPWKHVAAAGAILCYCSAIAGRRCIDKTCPSSV